ncbi:hypothetical protein [Oscillatoria acuminata]|uniref:hypothetical protein n=1 Tax=Oscillatoria acuminata TaxID=118323 RepID=UPI000312BACF|nr:hypothetical protein [Oscillatoria acuminata]
MILLSKLGDREHLRRRSRSFLKWTISDIDVKSSLSPELIEDSLTPENATPFSGYDLLV